MPQSQHTYYVTILGWMGRSIFITQGAKVYYVICERSLICFIVKTPTQPHTNQSWVLHKNDSAHHHPPPHKLNVRIISAVTDLIWTKLQSKLSGSIFNRCQLSQWHSSRQHLSWGHLSISAITQLILNQVWQNFKGKFLGPSLLDAIHQESGWHLPMQHLSWWHLSISTISDPIRTKLFGPNFWGFKNIWTNIL